MLQKPINLHPQWLTHLGEEFKRDYMLELANYLRQEIANSSVVYPAVDNIFAAFNTTPLAQVKVVILGQDPYHGAGQAHGLSFSVPLGVKVPPSLRNIYQEITTDQLCTLPSHGNLQAWANQGVLLLNSVLTVRATQAASHQGKGWERFTDKVIETINRECQHVVFFLWGSYAQEKGSVIDQQRHLVLTAPHPSPLSAYRGFFGCRHFSKANHYLAAQGLAEVDWRIK
jgi:uracil-DNA glycosylase